MADLGVHVHRRHLRQADQEARHHARQVQRADRHLQHAAPHDHQDRRRDDHREHRRHRGDRDREREVVAFLDLRLDEDLALARRVGRGRPGDAGEEHRQQHIDLRQRAGEVADHRPRQGDQTVGDAADVHQVGGQQEERHREQDERVVGLERRVEDDHRRQPRLDEQHGQAGEPQRERHRHAQDHQEEERAEQPHRRHGGREGCAGHWPPPCRIAARSPPRVGGRSIARRRALRASPAVAALIPTPTRVCRARSAVPRARLPPWGSERSSLRGAFIPRCPCRFRGGRRRHPDPARRS